MRLAGLTLLALVGCGGNGSSESGTDFVPTFEQNANHNSGACEDVPTFDISAMHDDCEALGQAFDDTVDAANECETASDCKVWRPQCEHWSAVGCYYSVNKCLDDGLLAEFNANTPGCWIQIGQAGICECGAAPDVECINGHCSFFYDY